MFDQQIVKRAAMVLLLLLPLALLLGNVIAETLPNRHDALVKNRRLQSSAASDYICSVDQITSDPCLFKNDGVCDADGVLCAPQSDCFDCDPCFLNHLTCGSCVADPACVWCEGVNPITGAYQGVCDSVEIATVFPDLCGTNASAAFGSVCAGNGTNITNGTCDILTDTCLYQFDLVCDTVGTSALCATGTDCFDCDPCQNIVTEAVASNVLAVTEICNLCVDAGCTYCTAPLSDGTVSAVCTSPYLASVVPNICINSGGSPFQNTCGSGGTPAPAPINTNVSQSCDYANDSCTFAMDGECDAGDSFFNVCDPNTDCIDCDPCQQKRYDGCDACVAAGCYWCPYDSLCLSGNPFAKGEIGNSANPFQKQFLCQSADDFTQTCPVSNTLFNDPLYEAENWVYDLIGVKPVWESGISKCLRCGCWMAQGCHSRHVLFRRRIL
jgi:hypothetical protein